MSGVETMDAEKAAAQESKAAPPDPKLVALRAEMKALGIQAFLVPSQDRAADGRCCPPVTLRLSNPRVLSIIACYDVASNINTVRCISRRVIDTQVEPSFLELNGIL